MTNPCLLPHLGPVLSGLLMRIELQQQSGAGYLDRNGGGKVGLELGF